MLTYNTTAEETSMIDAFLTVLAIAGGVSMAFVLAGLVSDGLLPWLERKFQKADGAMRSDLAP